jgi:hypothetical protein
MKHFVENVFMTKWITNSLMFLLFVLGLSVHAQNIPIGSWRSHFSYNDIQEIIQGNGKIICSSQHGLFFVNPVSNEVTTLSKSDGFSDVAITSLAYDETLKTLAVAYSSGLIDLFSNGKVSTIRDLNRSLLVGSKKVNDIITYGGKVYAGCTFGILEISPESNSLIDNYRSIGKNGATLNVKEMAVFDDKLFAISQDGIQYGELSKNLPDYNNWVYDPNDSTDFKDLTVWNGSLYAIANETGIAQFIDNQWNITLSESDSEFKKLFVVDDVLYALKSNGLYEFSAGTWQLSAAIDGEEINTAHYFDGFWFGHSSKGLESPNHDFILPNGPVSDNITKIRYSNNQLFALYGMLPEAYYGQCDSLGYETFNNYEWNHTDIEGFYNISDVAYFNGKIFLSSIGYGLYDTESKTVIEGMGQNQDGYDPVIPMLAVHDRLYGISFRHENTVFALDNELNLTSYPKSLITTFFPEAIYTSNRGTIWIDNSLADGGGVITFNPETEDVRYLSSSAGLPSQFIQGIQINNQDEAWVISDDGARIFADASYITEGTSSAYSPIYENQELFNNENLTAIAFDGGDRPWISTADGLWIFDQNLTKVDEFFSTENSPLPSHHVKDMTYNPKTGEMFILTDVGLVSYRSSSSAGNRTHSNVNIFPNPVRPGYEGVVGITGLVSEAYVKITDINGKLIRNLETNGSTASWDLNDYNGRRVNSGVYVVLSSSWDGLDNYIGKIAVIK